MTQFENFIDGTWQAPRSGQWTPNVNPARPAEVLGVFAASGPDDVSDAVAAAGGAARAWAASPPSERSALLVRLADLMLHHRDELARIIVREQGKALGEALGEVGRAAAECRYMAGESFRLLGATYPSDRPNCRIEERLEPVEAQRCGAHRGERGRTTKWSRGESNPRAGTVRMERLRV